MKRKKIILLLTFIASLLLFSNNAFATEAEETIPKVDFSEAIIEVVSSGNFYELEITDVILPTQNDGKNIEVNVRYTVGNTEPEFSSKYGESYPGTYNAEAKKISL